MHGPRRETCAFRFQLVIRLCLYHVTMLRETAFTIGKNFHSQGFRSLYTGRAGDWLVLKLTRARGGIMEPEYRLWLFSISGLLLPGGLILWGVGAAHSVQWFGLVVAMGIIGFTNSLGIQISISYCIESYRELGGEAIVTVILIRNTMSFVINYGFVNGCII